MGPKRGASSSGYRASVNQRAAANRQQRQEEDAQTQNLIREQRRAIVARMSVVAEKGVERDILEAEPRYREQFEARNWMNLVAVPKPANVELVRAFYVEASSIDYRLHKTVRFRGQNIRLGPSQINQFYGIPDLPECEHGWSEEVRETPLATITAFLHENGEEVEHIFVTNASVDANFWNLFVTDSILPVGKQQKFSPERARTIYAILTGAPVNVGQLIYDRLLDTFDVKANRSLVFPSLITQILKRHRIVVDGPGSILTQPTVLKLQAVNNQRNRKGVPKLVSIKERERLAQREARGSNEATSSARGGPSHQSTGRQAAWDASVLAERDAAVQAYMTISRELAESNMRLTEALFSERADKEAEIQRLREENARLTSHLQQHERMYGATFQRRGSSSGAGGSQPPPTD